MTGDIVSLGRSGHSLGEARSAVGVQARAGVTRWHIPMIEWDVVSFEDQLEEALASVAAKWPDIPADRNQLRRAVSDRLDPDENLDAAAAWSLADLHLALACLAGHPAALRELDRLLDEVAIPAVASRGLSRAEIDEITQQLRVRLLVGGKRDRPGLSLYSGRGRLAGFIRSSAVRASLNLRRDERRRGVKILDDLAADAVQDPALAHMKRAYLDEFRRSLAAAWAELKAEDQLFLRHQFEDELTIDDLARMYGMHRSTAARRLVAARDRLESGTRRQLRRGLSLNDVELDSILGLIRSRLGDAAEALG